MPEPRGGIETRPVMPVMEERTGRTDVEPFLWPDCSSFGASRLSLAHMLGEAVELSAFQEEPPQMRSDAPGKAGYLRMRFRHEESQGRTVLADMDRRAPLIAQKALYWEESQPDMACVIVIASSGCVVQGDRLSLDVEVEDGARALITTQGASKIHGMEHNCASQLQTFRLGENSWLEYMPGPLILHRSARYLQDTHVQLPASAVFLYGDILVPGRRWHHAEELFGFDRCSTGLRAMRPGASEALCEERLVLDPDDTEFRNVGVMGGYDILGSLYALVPERHVSALKGAIGADVTHELAWGASVLPGGAGLALRILGRDCEAVRGKMREVHSLIRHSLLGKDLPPEFLWR